MSDLTQESAPERADQPRTQPIEPRKDWIDRFGEWVIHTPTSKQVRLMVAFAAALMIPCLAIALWAESLNRWFGMFVTFAVIFGGLGMFVLLCILMFRVMSRNLLWATGSPKALRQLSGNQLELLACELYRRDGYKVNHHSLDKSADGGIDIILRKDNVRAVVQCKKRNEDQIGVDKVRELFGVMMANKFDRAIFLTTTTFTDDAEAFASANKIELIDGAELWGMVERARATAYLVELATERLELEDRQPPRCPRCGAEMVLRDAKTGLILGCSNYGRTNCGAIIPIRDGRSRRGR